MANNCCSSPSTRLPRLTKELGCRGDLFMIDMGDMSKVSPKVKLDLTERRRPGSAESVPEDGDSSSAGPLNLKGTLRVGEFGTEDCGDDMSSEALFRRGDARDAEITWVGGGLDESRFAVESNSGLLTRRPLSSTAQNESERLRNDGSIRTGEEAGDTWTDGGVSECGKLFRRLGLGVPATIFGQTEDICATGVSPRATSTASCTSSVNGPRTSATILFCAIRSLRSSLRFW
mmetsp:Transcript_14956/g.33220  ORF Transcript_14956/g.33220 Transcript_14956/m.33220 type:complete len:232 (+) Transcript_14956:3883-4578(+)